MTRPLATNLRGVLRFEREVVDRLVTTTDPRRRGEITGFVEGALAHMPEHLRLSIGSASVGLRVLTAVWPPHRSRSGADPLVHSLDTSPIPPIRQYVRLFRSLVLFAENEL